MSPEHSTVTRGLKFVGPGKYWEHTPSVSSRPRQSRCTPRIEQDLELWIRRATGSLSPNATSYAGALLYIKYKDTNVCPCGMVFHFTPDGTGKSACKKAVKAHVQTHEGVHFWDLAASRSDEKRHLQFLQQRYPGAAVIPFERWTVPAVYNGPDNVVQSKTFFFTPVVVPSTPPPSARVSAIPLPADDSSLSPLPDSGNEQDLDLAEEDDFPPDSLITPKKSKSAEIFCICQKPDDGEHYLQCECCEDWLHPACIGISEDQAEEFFAYYCQTCEVADDKTRAALAKKASTRKQSGTPIITTGRPSRGYRYNSWPVIKDPMVIEVVYDLSDDD